MIATAAQHRRSSTSYSLPTTPTFKSLVTLLGFICILICSLTLTPTDAASNCSYIFDDYIINLYLMPYERGYCTSHSCVTGGISWSNSATTIVYTEQQTYDNINQMNYDSNVYFANQGTPARFGLYIGNASHSDQTSLARFPDVYGLQIAQTTRDTAHDAWNQTAPSILFSVNPAYVGDFLGDYNMANYNHQYWLTRILNFVWTLYEFDTICSELKDPVDVYPELATLGILQRRDNPVCGDAIATGDEECDFIPHYTDTMNNISQYIDASTQQTNHSLCTDECKFRYTDPDEFDLIYTIASGVYSGKVVKRSQLSSALCPNICGWQNITLTPKDCSGTQVDSIDSSVRYNMCFLWIGLIDLSYECANFQACTIEPTWYCRDACDDNAEYQPCSNMTTTSSCFFAYPDTTPLATQPKCGGGYTYRETQCWIQSTDGTYTVIDDSYCDSTTDPSWVDNVGYNPCTYLGYLPDALPLDIIPTTRQPSSYIRARGEYDTATIRTIPLPSAKNWQNCTAIYYQDLQCIHQDPTLGTFTFTEISECTPNTTTTGNLTYSSIAYLESRNESRCEFDWQCTYTDYKASELASTDEAIFSSCSSDTYACSCTIDSFYRYPKCLGRFSTYIQVLNATEAADHCPTFSLTSGLISCTSQNQQDDCYSYLCANQSSFSLVSTSAISLPSVTPTAASILAGVTYVAANATHGANLCSGSGTDECSAFATGPCDATTHTLTSVEQLCVLTSEFDNCHDVVPILPSKYCTTDSSLTCTPSTSETEYRCSVTPQSNTAGVDVTDFGFDTDLYNIPLERYCSSTFRPNVPNYCGDIVFLVSHICFNSSSGLIADDQESCSDGTYTTHITESYTSGCILHFHDFNAPSNSPALINTQSAQDFYLHLTTYMDDSLANMTTNATCSSDCSFAHFNFSQECVMRSTTGSYQTVTSVSSCSLTTYISTQTINDVTVSYFSPPCFRWSTAASSVLTPYNREALTGSLLWESAPSHVCQFSLECSFDTSQANRFPSGIGEDSLGNTIWSYNQCAFDPSACDSTQLCGNLTRATQCQYFNYAAGDFYPFDNLTWGAELFNVSESAIVLSDLTDLCHPIIPLVCSTPSTSACYELRCAFVPDGEDLTTFESNATIDLYKSSFCSNTTSYCTDNIDDCGSSIHNFSRICVDLSTNTISYDIDSSGCSSSSYASTTNFTCNVYNTCTLNEQFCSWYSPVTNTEYTQYRSQDLCEAAQLDAFPTNCSAYDFCGQAIMQSFCSVVDPETNTTYTISQALCQRDVDGYVAIGSNIVCENYNLCSSWVCSASELDDGATDYSATTSTDTTVLAELTASNCASLVTSTTACSQSCGAEYARRTVACLVAEPASYAGVAVSTLYFHNETCGSYSIAPFSAYSCYAFDGCDYSSSCSLASNSSTEICSWMSSDKACPAVLGNSSETWSFSPPFVCSAENGTIVPSSMCSDITSDLTCSFIDTSSLCLHNLLWPTTYMSSSSINGLSFASSALDNMTSSTTGYYDISSLRSYYGNCSVTISLVDILFQTSSSSSQFLATVTSSSTLLSGSSVQITWQYSGPSSSLISLYLLPVTSNVTALTSTTSLESVRDDIPLAELIYTTIASSTSGATFSFPDYVPAGKYILIGYIDKLTISPYMINNSPVIFTVSSSSSSSTASVISVASVASTLNTTITERSSQPPTKLTSLTNLLSQRASQSSISPLEERAQTWRASKAFAQDIPVTIATPSLFAYMQANATEEQFNSLYTHSSTQTTSNVTTQSTCATGYTGDNCDIAVCSLIVCLNGWCSVDSSTNNPTCQCFSGFSGVDCSQYSYCAVPDPLPYVPSTDNVTTTPTADQILHNFTEPSYNSTLGFLQSANFSSTYLSSKASSSSSLEVQCISPVCYGLYLPSSGCTECPLQCGPGSPNNGTFTTADDGTISIVTRNNALYFADIPCNVCECPTGYSGVQCECYTTYATLNFWYPPPVLAALYRNNSINSPTAAQTLQINAWARLLLHDFARDFDLAYDNIAVHSYSTSSKAFSVVIAIKFCQGYPAVSDSSVSVSSQLTASFTQQKIQLAAQIASFTTQWHEFTSLVSSSLLSNTVSLYSSVPTFIYGIIVQRWQAQSAAATTTASSSITTMSSTNQLFSSTSFSPLSSSTTSTADISSFATHPSQLLNGPAADSSGGFASVGNFIDPIACTVNGRSTNAKLCVEPSANSQTTTLPSSPIATKKHHNTFPTGAIIGIVVGVCVGLLVCLVLLLCCSWIHQCLCFAGCKERIKLRRKEKRELRRQQKLAGFTTTEITTVTKTGSKNTTTVSATPPTATDPVSLPTGSAAAVQPPLDKYQEDEEDDEDLDYYAEDLEVDIMGEIPSSVTSTPGVGINRRASLHIGGLRRMSCADLPTGWSMLVLNGQTIYVNEEKMQSTTVRPTLASNGAAQSSGTEDEYASGW